MCNYSITLFLYILKYFVRCSDVSMLRKKYIPLPIYNFDDVVMSRENRNFHLRLFVKGGVLQTLSLTATPFILRACKSVKRLSIYG
jgi:hypothetical protein